LKGSPNTAKQRKENDKAEMLSLKQYRDKKEMKPINAKYWIFSIIAIAIAVIIPLNIESSPEWKVRVVNTNGGPVSGAYVKRSWMHFSAEETSHSDETYTDKEGYAYFSRKHVRTNLISMVVKAANNFSKLTIHASYGPCTDLVAIKGDYEGFASYDGNGILQNEIVLHERLGPKIQNLE
jgi:hypothetical protein